MSADALGLRILPYVARSTVKGGFAPGVGAGMNRGFERFPIGTGQARGTGEVGTTKRREITDYGDDKITYEGSTTATAISPVTKAPANPFAKTYSPDLKGMISERVDETLGVNPTYNPITGTFRQAELPGAAGALLPTHMQGIVEAFTEISRINLENIAKDAFQGDPNSAVGMLNGQIVAVSKGLFGQDVLSGNVPVGLSFAQTRALKDSLLNLAGTPQAAGAFTTYQTPGGMPDPETYDPGFTYGGQGRFSSEFSPVPTGVTSYTGVDPSGFYTDPGGANPAVADIGKDDPAPAATSQPYGGLYAEDRGGGRDDPSPSGNEAGYGAGGGFGLSHAKGGRIGYAMGTPKVTQGFINKDPDSVTDEQSIADNRYTKVELATMVMNQPSNDKYEKHLDKLITEAKRNVKLSDKKYKMVDVALSDGERTIHPEYVAYIEKKMGKGYLEKLNDEGKPEVSRRQAKYGSKIQGAQYGGIQTDRGFVQQFVRPDDPTLTNPTPRQQGFINPPLPTIDDDMYFGRRFGDIKSAIETVEIKGFEDNPFIFTGIKRKGAASSAFGPMQITASTLRDIKDRSKLYDLLGTEEKQYMDLLIQQGDDKVNIEKYRSMYRDGKKINTPKDIRKLYGRFGTGQIPEDLHKKYYDTIANITLIQKLQDHKTLEDALASYGEGKTYSQKVLKNLK